jgi:hypothetical protein
MTKAKPTFEYPQGVQVGISSHCMNCVNFVRPDRDTINQALAGTLPDRVTEQNGKSFVTVGLCNTKKQNVSFFGSCASFGLKQT